MATERITDQRIIEEISKEASILVIQRDEAGKEVLYETNLSALKKVLEELGIVDDFQKIKDFDNLKPDIVKKVIISNEKITVEQLDGTTSEYAIDTYQVIETLKSEDTVFVTTEVEAEDGNKTVLCSRVTFGDFLKALKEAGIHEGLMTSEDFTKQKENIVKNVKINENVLSVVFLNGRKYEYTIDTTFFDSANVDDEGYLHLTKSGKEVIPAILIPALKDKKSEITCKNVGYIFEEVPE